MGYNTRNLLTVFKEIARPAHAAYQAGAICRLSWTQHKKINKLLIDNLNIRRNFQ